MKMKKIMDIALPTPEAAEMATKAAAAGMSTAEYIGIQALQGAYGQSHPEVKAFNRRGKAGISGPETHDPERRRKS